MRELLESIKPLIADEVKRAQATHKDITSSHQAFGVLEEERREAEMEINVLNKLIDKHFFEEGVMMDDYNGQMDAILSIKHTAMRLAAEAIQVACVCTRTIQYLELEGK